MVDDSTKCSVCKTNYFWTHVGESNTTGFLVVGMYKLYIIYLIHKSITLNAVYRESVSLWGRGWSRYVDMFQNVFVWVDWSGLEWTGVDWSGLEWTGVDWSGLEWTGMDWSVCSDFFTLHHVYLMLVKHYKWIITDLPDLMGKRNIYF